MSQSECHELRWLLDDPEHEKINILLLRCDFHHLWDNHRFCFRPLEPMSPNHLDLEVLHLSTSFQRQVTISHERDTEKNLGFVIHTEASAEKPESLHILASGDKVRLTTTDADRYPLPSRALLMLQYNLHRALSASSAAEVLEKLFQDLPDLDEEEAGIEEKEEWHQAPFFTKHLIDEAIECGYISESEQPLWEKAFGIQDVDFEDDYCSNSAWETSDSDTESESDSASETSDRNTKSDSDIALPTPLEILFRSRPNLGEPGEDEAGLEEEVVPNPAPYFSRFLINEALARGIISESDIPLWEKEFGIHDVDFEDDYHSYRARETSDGEIKREGDGDIESTEV